MKGITTLAAIGSQCLWLQGILSGARLPGGDDILGLRSLCGRVADGPEVAARFGIDGYVRIAEYSPPDCHFIRLFPDCRAACGSCTRWEEMGEKSLLDLVPKPAAAAPKAAPKAKRTATKAKSSPTRAKAVPASAAAHVLGVPTAADPAEGITMLDAALHYARFGWPVIAIQHLRKGACACRKGADCERPAKHPIFDEARQAHGLKSASVDPKHIADLWDDYPRANIGIVTGAPSGLLVVDVDPRAGGDATLAELQRQHPKSWKTLTAKTGGGGTHIFFQLPPVPEGCTGWKSGAGLLGAGIDVKADGGYVLAAPSTHKSGGDYLWIDPLVPVAPCPAWLVKLLQPQKAFVPRAAGEAWEPASACRIRGRCAWFAHCYDDAADLDETDWTYMISILANCKHGGSYAHEWSEPYPGYRHAETQRKFERAKDAGAPVRCATINSRYCKRCRLWGKIGSPITVGRDRRTHEGGE